MSARYLLHRFVALFLMLLSFTFVFSRWSAVQADTPSATATPTVANVNQLSGKESSNVPKNAQPSQQMPLLAATSAPAHVAPNRAAERLIPSVKAAHAAGGETCYEYLGNNEFETYDDWLRRNVDADNVLYSTDYSSLGSQSIFFNNKDKSAGTYVDFWQPIAQIPANATSIYIEFDSYIRYNDITDGDEKVYFAIWDENGDTLVWQELNYPCSCQWYYFDVDLSVADLAGKSGLEVGFSLEGGSNQYYSEVYFDEAYLTVCTAGVTVTPTPIPPTATPTRLPPTATATSTPIISTPTPTSTPIISTPTPTQKPPTATSTQQPPTPTAEVPGDQFEADDQCTQASKIANDGVFQSHSLHRAGDVDWISFQAIKDSTYVLKADPTNNSLADISAELYVECAANAEVQTDLNAFAPGLQMEFVSSKTGTIFVKLSHNDPSQGGQNYGYDVSVRQLPNQAADSVLILVAGTLGASDPAINHIYYVTNQVRQVFLNNGYTDDRILYLAPNTTQGQQLPGVDRVANSANLEDAIRNFAASTITQNGALTLYFMDHGAKSKIYLDKSQNELVTPAQLNGWLTQLETARPDIKINIIIEACYAGSFIKSSSTISKANRVVIASTNADSSAWAIKDGGAVFSDQLLDALNHKASLNSAFQKGNDAAKALKRGQEPWLDSNGDGLPNQAADLAIASQRGFGIPGTLASSEWAPYVESIFSPSLSEIKSGASKLRAKVVDDGTIGEVWALIYPPSYQSPSDNDALIVDSVQQLILTRGADGLFSAPYTFTEAGIYRIVISAKDDQDLVAPLKAIDIDTTIALAPGSSALFLPLVQR